MVRIASEMSDQFALAILRLQHGMEDNVKRLVSIEDQLKILKTGLDRVEKSGNYAQQTHSLHNSSRSNATNSMLFNSSGLLGLIKNINWFTVTWPFVVYLLLASYEQRKQKKMFR